MTKTPVSAHLIEQQLSTLLFAEVHLFNCYGASRLDLISYRHYACRAFADFAELSVHSFRPPRVHHVSQGLSKLCK